MCFVFPEGESSSGEDLFNFFASSLNNTKFITIHPLKRPDLSQVGISSEEPAVFLFAFAAQRGKDDDAFGCH